MDYRFGLAIAGLVFLALGVYNIATARRSQKAYLDKINWNARVWRVFPLRFFRGFVESRWYVRGIWVSNGCGIVVGLALLVLLGWFLVR
jgi:hypothetical protein